MLYLKLLYLITILFPECFFNKKNFFNYYFYYYILYYIYYILLYILLLFILYQTDLICI